MKWYKISLGLITLLVVILIACSKNGKGGDDGGSRDVFKQSMLINYADTLIRPAYVQLRVNLTTLENAAATFLASPNVTNQDNMRHAFLNAYRGFESVSALYFGPAASLQFNNSLNTFPAAIPKIEQGIQTGVYDFTQFIVSDSIQGFPALDYLFFSPNAVASFNNASATNRKKYVNDIFARMKSLVNEVIAQWDNSFRNHFVASLQTNVGSSIGSLVNQFAFEMDAMKGPRIGWPFGKQSNGIVFADKCEAYFSGISKELAISNLNALRYYFTGGSGNGIADYLVLLGKQQLAQDVVTQFGVAIAALEAINGTLSSAFTSVPVSVENAYREVQKLLTLIKTDVASATAVQITYMDNDGD